MCLVLFFPVWLNTCSNLKRKAFLSSHLGGSGPSRRWRHGYGRRNVFWCSACFLLLSFSSFQHLSSWDGATQFQDGLSLLWEHFLRHTQTGVFQVVTNPGELTMKIDHHSNLTFKREASQLQGKVDRDLTPSWPFLYWPRISHACLTLRTSFLVFTEGMTLLILLSTENH